MIALVVGCAACVWDDVKAAQSLCTFDAVYCVKLAGVHWPTQFNVWVGLHPEYMDDYEAQRAALGLPNGYEIVAHAESLSEGMHGKKGNIGRRVSYRWCCHGGDQNSTRCKACPKKLTSSASSGIFAAKVALEDGHDRVILAGIPMDREAGHFTRGKEWAQRDSFTLGFEIAVPHLLDRVKSMSGYTRKILGAPSAEWLAGSGDPIGTMGVMPDLTARG